MRGDSSKSIYYTSNSFQNKYPGNCRSSFRSQIDEQEFYYINKSHVQIGVKEITFENKYNTFEAKYGIPNMIIVQDNYGQKPDVQYDQIRRGPEPPVINIKSGFDYYILSDQQPAYSVGKIDAHRGFTDVKISCYFSTSRVDSLRDVRFIVHNIYFQDSPFESDKELIDYLNYVYCNIEFDLPNFPPKRKQLFKKDRETKALFDVDHKGHSIFFDKRHMGLDIFLSTDLCQVLGFKKHELVQYPNSSLKDLLYLNFREKKNENIRGEKNWVFHPLFTADELHSFTNDSNVQEILDLQWPSRERYSRISQAGNIVDSFDKKVISGSSIDLEHGKPVLIGLRTSLTNPDIFKNCHYDTMLEFFNVKDRGTGLQVFEVTHPSLHATSIEKISNAKFELIDVDTGKQPNFSSGPPTFIHFHANDTVAMSNRFNLFLDSGDRLSKIHFPDNNPSDFHIKLPERMEFNKKWEISLKNIFIGNDMYNIYSRSCWFSVSVETEETFDSSVPTKLFLDNGLYKTIREVCRHIQTIFDRQKFMLKISHNGKTNRIKIVCEEDMSHLGYMRYTMSISSVLANILGFDRSNDDDFHIPFHSKRSHSGKRTYMATYSPNIELRIPRNFMVLCDVVSESVFGSNSIRILKLLSANFQPGREIINFDFHQEEFVGLGIKEFTSIRIQIVDTTGELIKSQHKYPTRCQIQFVKQI